MDFSQKLAAAKARRPNSKDVPVCIDGELADQRDQLLEAIRAAKEGEGDDQRLAAPVDEVVEGLQQQLQALTEAARDSIVTLRFRKLPGDEWAAITSVCPARVESPLDMHYGYNYDAACAAAATHRSGDDTAYAFRVEGETEIPLEVTEWADLVSVLSGAEVSEIRDAIWSLNEYDPAKRRDDLVKGFGAAARSDSK